MKIMMVCLGNICRSPIAEGIMRYKIQDHGLPWQVTSCGTGNWHTGEPPHAGSRHIMQNKKMDISHQRAKQFHYSYFSEYDLIFAMDSSNYRDLVQLAETEEEKQKVQMIMNLVYPGKNIGIPDPYYDETKYAEVFSMLNSACDRIIALYSK